MNDEYQERYLEHQARKTKSLDNFDGVGKSDYSLLEQTIVIEAMLNRRSQRMFNETPLTKEQLEWLDKAIIYAPSSCNRQAVYYKEIEPREAEKYLVGGKRWIDKGQRVILLFADKIAYKSPNEKDFMPWLDIGFVGANLYLMSEVLNIGTCFVNPNVRGEDKEEFNNKYNQEDNYFGGAMVFGNYDVKAKTPSKRRTLY